MGNGKYHSSGFTLIELMIVMLLLGVTTSLVAPDLYNNLQRSKLNTEKLKIRLLAELSVEHSFFSASELQISFEERTMSIHQLPNESKKNKLLKKISSSYFDFEKTVITVSHGKWLGEKVVKFSQPFSEEIDSLRLID
ncbi:hypothetical protein tinsulaeT_09290 [Thalassotalea insulae]|uniref:Prepilin-type N-terminal cleavage/methylation domain-containing protein n=1 Tax=Thalassotalea insulae TaxID=2056778 RepID=A0ABQ6GQY1_9GAMM|nr:prepilin-type N-terminal cleavage/methylation domain-containing protein [Thalassotalea insulae]GLX77589.1 hypothetical protein tinsulaeT_09290 [Thalassotalea insulae]